MFKKEAEVYATQFNFYKQIFAKKNFLAGAEFGYNKGYHDAEEHYMDVIDNQHKLVDESKKKHLEYAKTIIQDLLDNSDEYARQRAMDFLDE
ncbi:MAG: hypothetical protein J6V90_08265 [Treponema sp.]|nr:hypothetical protein [Treponema sp.]